MLTSHKNVQSDADGDCLHVETGLHQCDIRRSGGHSWWNLSLTITATHQVSGELIFQQDSSPAYMAH